MNHFSFKSQKISGGMVVLLLVFSVGLIFIKFLPETSSQEERHENKVGPRLVSPLLPTEYQASKVPVVINFGKALTHEELHTLELAGIEFRWVGSTLLHHNGIYTANLPYYFLSNPAFLTQIQRVEYAGRTLQPHTDGSIPEIGVTEVWKLISANETVDGTGRRFGVIDTGIDWRHPAFYFANGPVANVRSGSDDGWFFADLNGDGGFQSDEDLEFVDETFDGIDGTYNRRVDWLYQDKNGNNKFEYGSESRFLLRDLDGDDTISESDEVVGLGVSKIRTLWDQTDEDRIYVRGVNLTIPSINHETDPDQHGTHVSGILAGGHLGFDRRFVGVAPGAELVVVKTDYEEANVIAGIHWLVQEQVDVILMSLGGTTGYFLDGSSLLEQSVDAAEIPVVISGGNEGSFDRHVRTFVGSGFGKRKELQFEVVTPADGTLSTVYVTVLWQDGENSLRIYLQSPSSSKTELAGKDGTKRVGPNSVSYERSESERGTVMVDIEITRSGNVENGKWTLTIENQREYAQVFHGWIETEDISPSHFTEYATDAYTITNPATADEAIAVVSYDYTTGGLSYFSSQGPRIDEMLKPWVVAPGEAITSPMAGTWSHADFTGVSAAAPHVAGIVVLMRQADPTATREQIKARLAQGARNDIYTEDFKATPNAIWGYGKINAYQSVLLPTPVIKKVQLGNTTLQNASQTTMYNGKHSLTVTVQDVTFFEHQTTLQLEVQEIRVNQSSSPQEYHLAQNGTEWQGPLICQVDTTYILNFTVNDPLLASVFMANVTVEEAPLPVTTTAGTPPETSGTSSITNITVHEFVLPSMASLFRIIGLYNMTFIFGIGVIIFFVKPTRMIKQL